MPPPAPEIIKVSCAVGGGTGGDEKLVYSPADHGLSADITPQAAHRVTCKFRNGTVWVTKPKKKTA